MTQCPICLSEACGQGHQPTGDGHGGERYDCPRCGTYFLSVTLLATLPHTLGEDETKRALLSHAVRKMQRQKQHPFLASGLVEEILKGSLPSLFQQAENLVLWLGTHLKGPGESIWVNPASHLSIVGSRTLDGFGFVLEHLFDTKILRGSLSKTMSGMSAHATLTFDGWRNFDQLHRGAATSRKAFMAMKYGDTTLDFVVDKALRPALRKTGFSLQRLDEAPKAGLMTDYGLRYARRDFSSLTSPTRMQGHTGRPGSLKDSANLSSILARRASSLHRRPTSTQTIT
jgi:hypothetical protein